MKIKALFITCLLVVLGYNKSQAQASFTSSVDDNYSGGFSSAMQPASIVDNRYRWFFGGGFNYAIQSNYIANNVNRIYQTNLTKSVYREPLGNGLYFEGTEAIILTGIVQLTEKDAVGYSWRVKNFTNFDGISDDLSKMDFNSFTDPDIIGQQFNQGRLSYQKMQWAEHTFNYARVIRKEKKEFIKAGVGLKILNGVEATQLQTDGGDVTFNANGLLEFDGMEFSYGHSDRNQLNSTNLGFGLDIGVVYEYRPEYKYQYYEMDRIRKNPSKHINKYKYKVGASITNIGAIKFQKDTNSFDFNNSNNVDINYQTLFNTGLNTDYIAANILPAMVKSDDNNESFTMSLPTAINAQFDYAITEKFYASYSGAMPIWFRGDKSKIHNLTYHTISGRYEAQNVTATLPITFQRNGQVNVGAYTSIRVGKKENGLNIFFGSNNINNLLGQRKAYNVNAYGGIAIGNLYKKPKDSDGDLISDPNDMCPLDSGGYKLKGCPDADGDKIPDHLDFCPYSYGPKRFNGCPDSDKDGVFDYEDHCPFDKGLKANNGCPDRDKDGIIDTADRCPDVPGVWENNGCPMEYLTCCLDSDGDGLNDGIDSCVNVPGPAENNGCPTSTPRKVKDKTKYEKIDKVKLDEAIDNKKEEMKTQTVKQVLDEMATIDYLNIYFETDKDKIQKQFDPKIQDFTNKIQKNVTTLILILGHTDSDGSLEYNKKLSAKRSLAAKARLMKLGVAENRIVIKNYGEEKPAESNNSIENKSKNRRVEVRMMKVQY